MSGPCETMRMSNFFASMSRSAWSGSNHSSGRPSSRMPGRTPEAAPVEADLTDRAETMGGPQCGPAPGNPFLAWFRGAQEHIRSVALVPLGAAISGSGDQMLQPLAIAIISGALVQLPLVLLAMPVVVGLTLRDRSTET